MAGICRFCALLCCALAVLPIAEAQAERASIIGNITDNTTAAMAGVEVSVTNESTNPSIRVTT